MNILLEVFKNNKANLAGDDEARGFAKHTVGIALLIVVAVVVIGSLAVYKQKSEENQKTSINLINKQQTTIIKEK